VALAGRVGRRAIDTERVGRAAPLRGSRLGIVVNRLPDGFCSLFGIGVPFAATKAGSPGLFAILCKCRNNDRTAVLLKITTHMLDLGRGFHLIRGYSLIIIAVPIAVVSAVTIDGAASRRDR